MKKMTTDNSNKNLNTIKRRKFFLASGSVIFGLIGISKIPFNFIQSKINQNSNTSSIKITENPNAVKRKTRQADNG